MPTYVYRCLSCQHQMTLEHSIKDIKTQVCLDCGGLAKIMLDHMPAVLGHSGDPGAGAQGEQGANPSDQEQISGCCLHHNEPGHFHP